MMRPVVIQAIAQKHAMTSHRIADIALTAALTIIMLPMSASFAQPAGAGTFEAQMDEAKSIALTASSDTRSTIATYLSVAQALHAQGKEAQAEEYLRFASGILGLYTAPQSPDTQVGERAGSRDAVNDATRSGASLWIAGSLLVC